MGNRRTENIIKPALRAGVASAIAKAVTDWFGEYKRPLAFRETRDPYRIMVYEFMLQQTTVAVVQPYFDRFLSSFPTVDVLAKADPDKVMEHWAGLGYYRRAKQLQAAAVALMEEYGGVFPQDVSALEKLPGLGKYTAGSILATAFDVAAPIVEANTVRVFSRVAGITGVIGEGAFTRQVWQVSQALVSVAESPREFNMGAMELGALVCRPEPKCEICPVMKYCVAYKRGEQRVYPMARPKREKINVLLVGFVVKDNKNRYLVRRLQEGEWHAGLWEFPTVRCMTDRPVEEFEAKYGLTVSEPDELMWLKYTVTHHRISCQVFHCRLDSVSQNSELVNMEYRFLTLQELKDLPMGSAQRKIRNLLLNSD